MERSYYYFLEVFFLILVFFSSFREPLFSVYKFSKTQIIAMFKRSHKKKWKEEICMHYNENECKGDAAIFAIRFIAFQLHIFLN